MPKKIVSYEVDKRKGGKFRASSQARFLGIDAVGNKLMVYALDLPEAMPPAVNIRPYMTEW